MNFELEVPREPTKRVFTTGESDGRETTSDYLLLPFFPIFFDLDTIEPLPTAAVALIVLVGDFTTQHCSRSSMSRPYVSHPSFSLSSGVMLA